MNASFRRLHSLRWLTFLFCAVGLARSIAADPQADPAVAREALASAQTWLAEIDAGRYEQSYSEGCLAFHNKVTREQWVTVLKALRPPLGTVVTRKMATCSYKPDGFEGLEGECMVVTYKTTFSKMPADTEILVLKREDGRWRGAGYNSQPQADADNDSPGAAEAHTEVDQQAAHPQKISP